MTEREWMTCTDADAMLAFVSSRKGRAWERKVRLFACACLREVREGLPAHCRAVVEAAELDAGGLAPTGLLSNAARECEHRTMGFDPPRTPGAALHDGGEPGWMSSDEFTFARACLDLVKSPDQAARAALARTVSQAQAVKLLLDIYGPLPFRPVTLNRAWLSANGNLVPAVARSIYERAAFEEVPVLCDALVDVGCADPAILDHCRSGERHVRGCWCIDLFLGGPAAPSGTTG